MRRGAYGAAASCCGSGRSAWRPASGRGQRSPPRPGPRPPGRRRRDSVILLWMAGGVTHIDSFDPKPERPRRGAGDARHDRHAIAGSAVRRVDARAGAAGPPDRPGPELLARQQRPLPEPGLCALGAEGLADSDHDRAERGVGGVVSAGPAERVAGLCRGARDHAAGAAAPQPVRGRLAGRGLPPVRCRRRTERARLHEEPGREER